jgi:hypothetical protein
MNEEIALCPSIWRDLRPTWRSASFVLACAIVCGMAGLYIRLASECWSENQDCAGYFPLGVGISNLLSWPIVVMERFAFGQHGFVSSYDPVIAGYWWILVPVLWVYYYMFFAGAKVVVALIRSFGHRG